MQVAPAWPAPALARVANPRNGAASRAGAQDLGPDNHVYHLLPPQFFTFCRSAGFSLQITQEAAQSQTIISLVSAGLGLAILPESIRGLRRAGVAYRALREQSPAVETVVAHRKDLASLPGTNFVRLARKHRVQERQRMHK